MSWLLVVPPDPVQAGALCDALRGNVTEDIVVAESLDAALSLIDERVPDVILLPSLMPAAVEDYVVSYLGTIPGADHVQILGLPVLTDGRRSRSSGEPVRYSRGDDAGSRNHRPPNIRLRPGGVHEGCDRCILPARG